MQPYINKAGKKSGVAAYSIGKDYVMVQFKSGDVYRYTYASAGEEAIEEMKRRAIANYGLSTYISQNNPRYAMKY